MATDGLTTTTSRFKPPIVPAAFFGIVLGLAGLGSAWPRGALGYGLLQALLLLLRLLPWIMEQPFAASYWGFAFGATAPIRMAGRRYRGDRPACPVSVRRCQYRGRPDRARDVTPDRAGTVCCLQPRRQRPSSEPE
jgi:hypothetical protein